MARHDDPRAQRVIDFFEALQPADLQRMATLYTEDATFKDPFNEVAGCAAIEAIFAHMFTALDEPRFHVHDVIVQGDQCFLSWDFRFRIRQLARQAQQIRGATHLRFAADGRIAMHRDYWDAAEELYAKLPVLGGLMRWLRRRLGS